MAFQAGQNARTPLLLLTPLATGASTRTADWFFPGRLVSVVVTKVGKSELRGHDLPALLKVGTLMMGKTDSP